MECLCEGASCSSGSWCLGQQCFTSLSILNGTSVLQKGCIVAREEGSTRCQRAPTPELVVECCYGDLCNMNASLQFPVKGAVVVFCWFLLLSVYFSLNQRWFWCINTGRSVDCNSDFIDRCPPSYCPAGRCLLRCHNWNQDSRLLSSSDWIFTGRTCFCGGKLRSAALHEHVWTTIRLNCCIAFHPCCFFFFLIFCLCSLVYLWQLTPCRELGLLETRSIWHLGAVCSMVVLTNPQQLGGEKNPR